MRLLWKHKRHWQDVDAFAEYVRQNHPHMLPKDVQGVTEYMRSFCGSVRAYLAFVGGFFLPVSLSAFIRWIWTREREKDR